MLQPKNKYTNHLVLSDGSSIIKKSLKNYKTLELLKDNYNFTYISNLNDKNLIDLSEKTPTSIFLNKFTNKKN